MKNFRKLLIGTSFVLVATSFPPALVGAASNVDAPSPPNTAPHNAGAQGSPQSDYAVDAYARQKGVSKEVAAKHLVELGALTDFADQRRKEPGFAAFRVVDTPAGPEGQLAATSIKTKSFDAAKKVRLFPAAIAESDYLKVSDTLADAVRKSGVPDAGTVAVDPFTGETTVWRMPVAMKPEAPAAPKAGPVDAPQLRNPLRQAEPRLSTTGAITVKLAPGSQQVRGGQREVRNTSFFWFWEQTITECTSGFGVNWVDGGGVHHPGYFTAGHCEGGGWKINGNNVIKYWDRSIGGYKDRVIMEANGASWLVWNGIFNEDMRSDPTHIFQGAFYCQYSRRKYGQVCGHIQNVNVPVQTPKNGVVWTTEGTPEMRGIGGDSGGPVWQPVYQQESRPAGLMEAADRNTDRALYTALDDNMVNSGYRLL